VIPYCLFPSFVGETISCKIIIKHKQRQDNVYLDKRECKNAIKHLPVLGKTCSWLEKIRKVMADERESL